MFGYENTDWRPWTLFDGTPVLVPGDFNTQPEPNGDILMYPQGDRSAPASGRMPRGGYYFDTIIRQELIDDDRLDPQDNMEEFGPLSDEDLQYFAAEADRLHRQTDKAIVANFGGTAFGDIALVPAPFLKHPKGIRDVEEWYVSTVTRFDYVRDVFRRQAELALANLGRLYEAVGDRVHVVYMTGRFASTARSSARPTGGSTSRPPPALGCASARPGRPSSIPAVRSCSFSRHHRAG